MIKTWGALLLISSALTVAACGDSSKNTVDAPSGGGDTLDAVRDRYDHAESAARRDRIDDDRPIGDTVLGGHKPSSISSPSQINDNCGLLGGAAGGAAVAFTVMDDEGMSAIAKTDAMTMIATPVAGIITVHARRPRSRRRRSRSPPTSRSSSPPRMPTPSPAALRARR